MGLILLLRQTYIYVLSINANVEYYHQAVILTIVIANIIVFFVGFIYRAVCGKHRLSYADKMKLKDLWIILRNKEADAKSLSENEKALCR